MINFKKKYLVIFLIIQSVFAGSYKKNNTTNLEYIASLLEKDESYLDSEGKTIDDNYISSEEIMNLFYDIAIVHCVNRDIELYAFLQINNLDYQLVFDLYSEIITRDIKDRFFKGISYTEIIEKISDIWLSFNTVVDLRYFNIRCKSVDEFVNYEMLSDPTAKYNIVSYDKNNFIQKININRIRKLSTVVKDYDLYYGTF